jgi:hypothetical protein
VRYSLCEQQVLLLSFICYICLFLHR